MRLAVISDIHGNMEALEQVLADIDRSGVDETVCLGDMIGYGPDPRAVIGRVQKREIPCVAGNHELAVNDPACMLEMNLYARISLEFTRGMLSGKDLDFIRRLPSFLVLHECRFVHGFPPDSPIEYLSRIPQNRMRQVMSRMTENICFVGHTHLLGRIEFDGTDLKRTGFKGDPLFLKQNWRYIVNAGSVGQPRDPDKRAKYVIWDTKTKTVEPRYVDYDRRKTAGKIRDAGLPEIHAHLLL